MKELKVDKNERILVVAPHPDDEIIGCGGLISLFGNQCDVLLMTDGCKGHTVWSESRTRRVRRLEFDTVMKASGVHDYKCREIRDRELSRKMNCYSDIDLNSYDAVFVPNMNEEHPDHKAASRYLMLKAIQSFFRGTVYQYEVWTPLKKPSHLLDISNCIEDKRRLLAMYDSQIKELNYIDAALGLNQYRGALNGTKYAECYKRGLI